MKMPSRGDIVYIKQDLSRSCYINGDMNYYRGMRARVTAVYTEKEIRSVNLKGGFAVHLDVDGGAWFWYPDALAEDSNDVFKC